jgi:hypothetical protein
MIVTIPANNEECFRIRTFDSTGTRMYLQGNYQLLDKYDHQNNDPYHRSTITNSEPLVVLVLDSNDKQLYESTRQRGANNNNYNAARGSFRVPITANQKYWLCLQNVMPGDRAHPDGLSRSVGLSHQVISYEDVLIETSTFGETWINLALSIQSNMIQLLDHQDYVKVQEANQRIMVEETFSQILAWNFAQALVVVVIAAGQVFVVRRFVEKKPRMIL